MDNRYEIAEQNGMSREFADWFFDNKKAGCGNVWFMMMAAMWEGWQGRAAMLQGAGRPQNEPQNIPENIPATQFKPVADLYGLTSPTGGETSFTFDAVEARDFIDGGWSCQEYVELERFQEAVSGNSPVIPDGWVLVPEEPTHEMLEAGDEQFGTYDVYRRMIAASPQQK
ncbi:eaa protein [Escherichia coli]|uniref:eaa protein n=1 Tax=Escherichia coli TaxID=562 RepID=UPI000DE0B7A3|nr:eaa protein [Escherichia coli]